MKLGGSGIDTKHYCLHEGSLRDGGGGGGEGKGKSKL
jgi:hypothetical protein